ncbi:uncharacterized protein LOC126993907 isoform X1 [Eriocheir sinensis]|uniref:uncharacterized protein LOC126993907 isoform X1 n=1 Tax=Eriocheir sinensis TaxID=95602 RepID=UPI0021C9248A|nr:uncharacterized protein LOC126993907 isoform X1 [Eriocheir sinensis]
MNLVTVALLVLAGTVSGDFFAEVDLKQHMETFFKDRYPIEDNRPTREAAREYIKNKFSYYGLEVHEQKFNTTINTDPKGFGSNTVTVEGTNIIGIKKAITQQADAVVVVGADYDSNGLSDPLFYNGAGVAALLEVAHVYSFNTDWSGRFADNFTTIFVAFDINTKHYKGSSGRPGGYYFVNKWLWNYIDHNVHYFGGAVILDSIMNVQYEPNTQTLTQNFHNLFPDTYQRVIESGGKGDFLAMVSLKGSEDSTKLSDQFSGAYYKDRRGQRYRLENMVMINGGSLDPMIELIVECDNIHFWAFKDDRNNSIALPALLLTDTATFRSNPKEGCSTCRPVDLLTEERLEFVNATVRATTRFLLDRQATLLPPKESNAVSSLPSILMTALMMCLVRLYM